MKITPLKDIPDRPESLIDNTDEEGTDFSVRRILENSVSFDEETTFIRRSLQLGIFPCVTEESPGLAINDSWTPLTLDGMNLGKNNIGMLVAGTKVQILEHIIGVLA